MRLFVAFVFCAVALFQGARSFPVVVFMKVTNVSNGKTEARFLAVGTTGHTTTMQRSLKIMSDDFAKSTTLITNAFSVNNYIQKSMEENSKIMVKIFIKICSNNSTCTRWIKLENISTSNFKFEMLSSNHATILYHSSTETQEKDVDEDITKALQKLPKDSQYNTDTWITVNSQNEKWDIGSYMNSKVNLPINGSLNPESTQINTPIMQVTFEKLEEVNKFKENLLRGDAVVFVAEKRGNESTVYNADWNRFTIGNIFVEEDGKSLYIEIFIRPKTGHLMLNVYKHTTQMTRRQADDYVCKGTIFVPALVEENLNKITVTVDHDPSHYFQIGYINEDDYYMEPEKNWECFLTKNSNWTDGVWVKFLDGSGISHKIYFTSYAEKCSNSGRKKYPVTFKLSYKPVDEKSSFFWN